MTITIYHVEIIKGEFKGKKGYSFDYPSGMLYKVTVHCEEDNKDYWVDPSHVKVIDKEEMEVPAEYEEIMNGHNIFGFPY